MDYIEVIIDRETITVAYNGKEYEFSSYEVFLDYSNPDELIVRENSSSPIESGEEIFRLPLNYTVIHHICQ